ncbi:probable multidrug resistance-associated protein lethal(2)03659 isoform X2 [Daktulosphaira vitifoliae]|uniref:probable multidrug resistance-associated protein lethal(2)03659 isoform X2 n=1 Tax=Daktulosphaira vitifoliae TaxID=58002 RepID=UPI0021AAE747|nr:probable multidrug resistance-associated protein lethal(2)03659 isoform X2 [Daktulosphaira vitifoliae]
MDAGFKKERPPHPRSKANFLEVLTFSWTLNLFNEGKKRDLEVEDLYKTLDVHKSAYLGNKLDKVWLIELANAKLKNRKPSLLRALASMFGVRLLFLGIFLAIVEIGMSIGQPHFLGRIIAHFDPLSSSDVSNLGLLYGLGLVVTTSLKTFGFTAYDMLTTHMGMKMRVSTCNLIYNKALRLSKTALGETTVGQVVNLLSNDVNRFDIAIIFIHYLWIGPLQTILVLYFLWQEVGPSSVVGVAILLLFIPLQGWLGKKTSEFRMKTAIRTDERVRLMNEIISGIQVIKMYTWEKPFAYLVQYARKKEVQQIKGASFIRAILLSFMVFHTRIALFASILSYVILGNYIDAQKVFVITSYYNILRTTMTVFFPQGIGQVAEVLISVKRLQNFLMYEEKNNQVANLSKANKAASNGARKPIVVNGKSNGTQPSTMELGIVISNVTAKWTDAQIENSLEKINLTVVPGRLVAIIGPVGSGKSSLFQAILRELPLSEGNISVNGVMSYASQEPWLFAGSVQQNILFGSPMNEERYKKVIKVCALKKDFEQFPYGDRTIVGERGVSLSGGQRARINLARAVYKEADIYLMDDPLSAVDTHVGKHLFDKCIKGFLKEKTCVLITHQLQYLNSVDQIILMQNGNVLREGSYNDLLNSGLDFTNLLHASETSVEAEVLTDCKSDSTSRSKNRQNSNLSRQMSVQSVASSVDDSKNKKEEAQPIEVDETRSYGNVSLDIYSSYFSAGGSCLKVTFLLSMCVLTQILASGGDYWITYWVNLEENVFQKQSYNSSMNTNVIVSENDSIFSWFTTRNGCIIVFSVITFAMIVAALIRSITFVAVCMKASMNLHNKMFNCITRATMYFFNTNSSGRILNRFSKDMGAIDELLPAALIDCIQIGLTLLGIIVVVAIVNIYLMIPTIIVAIIFYKLRVYYLSTSRSVKRLEGVTRSPVFAHLNATLQGLTTIRAFGAEQILSKEFDNHQDLHSSAWFLFITSSRAFGFWLDVVCLFYISIVTFSFLTFASHIYGGNVGLAITQAIGLTGMFQWGMRQSAELENQMTSVERVLEYTNAPQESALESTPDKKPPKDWPAKGRVTFKKLYLRYGPDTQHVLKDLNINIEPSEKVGIVGRTGAGKSSLIGALFRLAINEGYIIIDNIDIHSLGLHELRSKISIIPQEPVLFSGTMRKNLDPFDEFSDHALWEALEEVELKDPVEDLPGGLNAKMSEGGSNFSVGQRQLVCLARAIIRNNKILVLDEATANVDPQTDALIQNTIRTKFSNCTVLTIAHRLNTVMDSDKILVMDAGNMVEFDYPHILLQNKHGFLFKMVEETGPSTAELLCNIAEESYKKKLATRESPIKLIDEDTEENTKKDK